MRLSTVLGFLLVTAPVAAQAASGTLVLYTSQFPEVAQETVDAFQAKYPSIKVEWTRNGTSQLMNILRTEIMAGDVKPDVLLVADTINLGQLKKEGRLLPYPEAPVKEYDKSVYDADMTYFGTKIISTGIVYNTKNAKPVETWGELLVTENKNQIAVPSPLYSGAALNHLHTVINIPEIGWEFYQKLASLDIVPEGGNGPALKAVSGGAAKYGVIADADVIRAKSKGSPVEFIFPKDGVSFITEPVAILSTTRNVEAAKAFVDFLLSREGQKLVVGQGNMPIDPKIAPPPGFPALSSIRLLPLDTDRAIQEDESVRARFTKLFGG